MKIALAQLNYHIGNLAYNKAKILQSLEEAREGGADLVVFAEMAITGYPAKDLWESEGFIHSTEKALQEIAEQCQGIACLVGAPLRNQSGSGKALYNAALLLSEGQVQVAAKKALVPDYDVFDEYRYFQPSREFQCLELQGVKLGVSVCEDLWNVDQAHLYHADPAAALADQGAQLMINIAASPFSVGHYENRLHVLKVHQRRYGLPFIYVNQIGAHADLIFDGRSLALAPGGEIVLEMSAFQEALHFVEFVPEPEGNRGTLRPGNSSSPQANSEDWSHPMALVHAALLLGIRDYFDKSGFRKAVLGLSGGLDSAVVAALACEALGSDRVVAVLMPSAYSSDHSIQDALDLVRNTGCEHHIVPIRPITSAFDNALQNVFAGLPLDTTEENIQARIRGALLMAFSNKFGHTLLNTSNKSEMAVGYGTLYGDMAGAFSVIGDLFKTDVYRLAEFINRNGEVIPLHTIVKPPSAELRPDQKDSDSLPEYPVLDRILRAYIEEKKDPAWIRAQEGDVALVDRIVGLVDRAEFKRFQSCPILRVSKRAFGAGRSMPLVARITW